MRKLYSNILWGCILLIMVLLVGCNKEDAPFINELTCQISFENTDEEPVILKKGEKLSYFEPVKLDYQFEGWYIDENCTIPFQFDLAIHASITLFAKWTYVPPVVITPQVIEVTDFSELLCIKEVKELIEKRVNHMVTFNYYKITGQIIDIKDAENGMFTILFNEEEIIIRGIDQNLTALNVKIGDFIVLTSLFTYLDGLSMLHAQVEKVNYINHYVNVDIGDEILQYDLQSYDTLENIPIPNKDGYIFCGWYYDSDFKNPINNDVKFDSDIIIYAKFTEINYFFITYHISDEVVTTRYSEPVYLNFVDIPYKEEYQFIGWYRELEGINEIKGDVAIQEDMDIYAIFQPLFFCVTFHIDQYEIQEKYFNQLDISTIPNPEKEEYMFVGWYKDENFTIKVGLNEYIYDTCNLYAKFDKIPYYYVTIYWNDEKVSTNQWIEHVGIYTLDIPQKEGYEFMGWYFDKEYQNKIPTEYMFTSDITIYGYLREIKYYDISVYIDDWNTPYQTYHVQEQTTLLENDIIIPYKENYLFVGWFLDQACNDIFETTQQISEDLKLYAKFIYVETYYTITLIVDGSSSISNVVEGTKISQIPRPSIENYLFVGWYKDRNYLEKYEETDEILSDSVLYGYMHKIVFINIYTSILDEIVLLGNYPEGTTLFTILDTPYIPDYIFDGWYLDNLYTHPVDKTMQTGTNDITLFAKFIPISYYNIKTMILGEENVYNKVREGAMLSSIVSPPQLTDYVFEGWYLDEEYTMKVESTYIIQNNVILYAKLTKINYYTITIILDGIPTIYEKIKEGTLIQTIICTPEKEGYYFKGWYDSDEYQTKVDSNQPIQDDWIGYALFIEIPYYEIKLYVDGQCVDILSMKDQSLISTIAKPIKADDYYGNYTFVNWYSDETFETVVSQATKISSDMTLYAKFSMKRYYHVKYVVNDLENSVILLEPNHCISYISKPTAYSTDEYHYTFAYWSTDISGENRLSEDYVFTETDTVIYAYFSKIPYYIVTIQYLDNTMTQKVLEGASLSSIHVPNEDGYVYSGWYSDLQCMYPLDNLLVIDRDMTIYAKMKKYIQITIIANHESSTIRLLEEDVLSSVPIPDIVDFRFVDWFLDAEFTESMRLDSTYVFLEDVTIYAQLTPVLYYTVYVCLDSTTQYGLITFTKYRVKEETTIKEVLSKIDTPTVSGYEFDAYYTTKTFDTLIDENIKIMQNTYIYAHFYPKHDTSYTIKYWLETLNGYSIFQTLELKGTTGEDVYPEILEISTYQPPSTHPHGVIKGDGSLQIDVYYTRAKYTIQYWVDGKIMLESEPIKWGTKVTFISNARFEELVGDAFISGWYEDEAFTKPLSYEEMPIGGINVYGDVELIIPGTEGIVYALNDSEDGYIVVDYIGNESSVVIANGYEKLPVIGIAEAAFYNVSYITSITMSNHIVEIGDRAFYGCTNLETIVLSDAIECIGNQVFYHNYCLKELSLPKALIKLGYDNFKNLEQLEKITVSTNNTYFTTQDNVLFDKNMETLYCYASMKTNVMYTIPDSVKSICSYAFSSTKYLETLYTNIGLNRIQSMAIHDCKQLKTIFISKTIAYLEQSFLENLSQLENIIVDEENLHYTDENGVLYNKEKTILIIYPSHRSDTIFSIPDSVRSIGQKAFCNNQNLTSIYLPITISKASYLAFYNCPNLIITCAFSELPRKFHQIWYENIKELRFN